PADDEICVKTSTRRTFNTLVFQVEVQGYLASDTSALANGVGAWTGLTTGTTTRGAVQQVTIPSGTLITSTLGQATFTLTVARTSALPTAPDVSNFTVPVRAVANSGDCG
ncbi:MAG TPA: hypothetical protein VNU01_02275, partial [Egibacteraceae bacterium]|nr:hypothetical protein [Egibacteraceae bacterium]